jgi:AbrB family looped-hinge helix DNA binding protein
MNARVKLSSKGQIVLPKAIRDAHGWGEGTELELVDDDEGVRIRPSSLRPSRRAYEIDEVAGMIKYDGPPVSIEDMDRAIVEEARRRWNEKSD